MGWDSRVFKRGEGVRLWDDRGIEYLDFIANYGSLNLGHNHPDIAEALQKVASTPNFMQWWSLAPLAGALANNLAALAPGDLDACYFCNSGAEAAESALKLARVATKRKNFVSTVNSFHGKTTMGALAVTGKPAYREPFEPVMPNVDFVPYGDIGALEAALSGQTTAGFIVEPIQGEGGVILPPPGYLKTAQEICRRYGTLLIVDEIQTGLGRTGRLFACEEENVEPDVLLLAKSLGGGFYPIGAMITASDIWNRAYGGIDSSRLVTQTFGGGAYACAAAIAALNVTLKEGLAERAAQSGAYLLDRLCELREKHSIIKEVRGRGLMIGIEFNKPTDGLLDKLSAGKVAELSQKYLGIFVASDLIGRHRIVTAYHLNNPNVIRVAPPLIVETEQIDRFVDALDDTCGHNKGFLRAALRTGGRAATKFAKK